MAEVIGLVSGIITVIETSIKLYDGAQKDIKLSETFEAVRRRLPVILDTLLTCKENLAPRKELIPEDVCEALEATLYACRTKARNLEEIFEKIVPGESDTREQRYLKILRRLGKGNKVEELMLGLAEDVQLLVNHDAVKSANREQNSQLEDTINEMRSVISGTEKLGTTMSFSSGGGAQTNYVQQGRGDQYISNGGKQYNAEIQHFVEVKQKEDFGFHGPVGVCLGKAPYIAPELFIGRGSELDEIAEILHPVQELQKHRRLVLGGMGGIGKTRLAIAYAESQFRFYSSVFWLNAASEATLKDSFRSIASLIFDIQDSRLLEGKDTIGRVHQWLSDSTNTQWLLIFDNYDDPDQFEINNYYPHTISHGAIIVTTRWPDRVGGNLLHVKPLQDIEDSLAVLRTRSKRENVESDPHAKGLAKRLAGLPIALATAGTYLQRSTLSFERYLQEYEKRWNLDPRHPTKLQEYRERTLYTTWNLSYARLETIDSAAAKLLKLLAYFGNNSLCIDEEHYWYAFNCVNATTSGVDEHSLGHVEFSRAASHALRLVQCRFLEHDMISISTPDRLAIALNVSRLLQYQSQLSAAEQLYVRVLAGYEQALGADHISTLAAVHDLGLLYTHLVMADKAEAMFVRVIAGYEKVLGPGHLSTLDASNNLGNIYVYQGKLDKAEGLYLRALNGYDKDHPSTFGKFNNLGNVYLIQGKLDKAEEMYVRALPGQESAQGPDHIPTLLTIHNLGNLYSEQGKPDKAEEMYLRALAGREKVLGPDHSLTLITVNNLGRLYADEGKMDKAGEMYGRALNGRVRNAAKGPSPFVLSFK
ncbi:uncharacterized protein N7443_005308 [Penicillium atrosanguineum]|uniref:uncharacterized protein n=1 Tax=Penicillium atrosanguineum TaxID=1132637 RepID=UPI0023893689|nr:uncharacterized protein N7443_005308 [Penicillium atrosanguineum]KAJ5300306.1 hypothetical protein N7443_005308 [Penicillium atrosanguineum]